MNSFTKNIEKDAAILTSVSDEAINHLYKQQSIIDRYNYCLNKIKANRGVRELADQRASGNHKGGKFELF